jgi:hypothetical protein
MYQYFVVVFFFFFFFFLLGSFSTVWWLRLHLLFGAAGCDVARGVTLMWTKGALVDD